MKLRHEALLAATIVVLMAAATLWVLTPVYGYEAPATRLPTWSPPDIPQCERELYERITEGCPNE